VKFLRILSLLSVVIASSTLAGCTTTGASTEGSEAEFFKKVLKAAAKAKCGSRCSQDQSQNSEVNALRDQVDKLDREIRSVENDLNLRCVDAGYVGYSPALKRCM
jgi:outer membrane murein-binding lipoprotein Lpp